MLPCIPLSSTPEPLDEVQLRMKLGVEYCKLMQCLKLFDQTAFLLLKILLVGQQRGSTTPAFQLSSHIIFAPLTAMIMGTIMEEPGTIFPSSLGRPKFSLP